MGLEQVKGSGHRAPHCREFDHKPVNIAYCSSHEDHEERAVRWRDPLRDDVNDLKIKAPKFYVNLKPKNCIDWVQARGSVSSRSAMTREPLSELFSS